MRFIKIPNIDTVQGGEALKDTSMHKKIMNFKSHT